MQKANKQTAQNTFKEKPKKDQYQDDLKGQKFSLKKSFQSLKDKRVRKISGLFLILISLYLFLSFTSYLFNWKVDDDLFAGRPFNWQLLTDTTTQVGNMMGRLGAITAHLFIKKWFGIMSYVLAFFIFLFGFKLLTRKSLLPMWKTIRYGVFFILWFSVTFGFIFTRGDLLLLGGTFGYMCNVWLNGIFGKIGTGFVILFSGLSFLILVYNLNLNHFKSLIVLFHKKRASDDHIAESQLQEASIEIDNALFDKDADDASGDEIEKNDQYESEEELIKRIKQKGLDNQQSDFFEYTVATDNGNNGEQNQPNVSNPAATPLDIVIADDSKISNSNYQPIDDPSALAGINDDFITAKGDYDPTLELSSYKLPSVDLLDDYGSNAITIDKQELEANKNRILDTLKNYAIQIDKIKATIGPTVTLYEIVPAAGVRISKIRNLEDDIALSLSALGIRIIAPIPGRGTIGIEVPNSRPEIVSMKSILGSEKFKNSTFDLPIGLGKTIANETYIADLTKMPHLLMAGATGQGKSVGLNAILASILFKKHPSLVKFVLVDPKKVELTLFSRIERHYLAKLPDSAEAIITDTRKVVRTLNSLCIEMDNRYDLLKDAQVRTIKEYNAKFISRRLNPKLGHNFLPYIILIIDEFADLIMTAGKEIELPIARLAQLARAVGIHLVIATQRPSVNIITGMIKANFPARMAFRVSSKIDSRTILDSGGADQLIGRGDMLLSTGSDLLRLQCAFIDTPEIERLTEYIGSQRAFPEAFMLPEVPDTEGGDIEEFDPSERDELFEDAARVIVATQQGSTSLLQRKLKLGYNRAGRIIDQLEAAGIVGPFEGSKAREVKIKDEVTLEQILRRGN